MFVCLPIVSIEVRPSRRFYLKICVLIPCPCPPLHSIVSSPCQLTANSKAQHMLLPTCKRAIYVLERKEPHALPSRATFFFFETSISFVSFGITYVSALMEEGARQFEGREEGHPEGSSSNGSDATYQAVELEELPVVDHNDTKLLEYHLANNNAVTECKQVLPRTLTLTDAIAVVVGIQM